jgi:threonine synthase
MNMSVHFAGYVCSVCGHEFAPDAALYTCPDDGGNLEIFLEVAALRRTQTPDDLFSDPDHSLWRFLPLLPVADPGLHGTPLRQAGGTPVFSLGRLAARLNLRSLWLKDESRNPSASFKDRASAVVVARALQIAAQPIVTASTGNAGAALACMAASAGLPAVILAPKTAPPAKIAQLLIFGARVVLIDGTYDDAFDLTIRASQEFGWYCRNTGFNPFTLEGKKTAAFEIWEWWSRGPGQRNTRPLNIFVSVGDGNIISGIHKGFKDLDELGWLEQMPRIFGVQAAGSAAVANAFRAGTETIQAVQAHTLADSISVDFPRDGLRALRAARDTGGAYLTVADEEILVAIAALGPQGIFAEPAGATAYAGLVQAVQNGLVGSEDPVLVINTGSGLKDVRAAMQAAQAAPIIAPDLQALKQVLG